MIRKRSRLPGSDFSKGAYRTIRTPYFLLKFKGNNEEKNRIGVVAGIAVHKTAVRRNFWKRQAKAGLIKAKMQGRDFLMILSPRVNDLTRKQFQEAVSGALASII